MKKTLGIEGMSCGHCAAAVKKALSAVAGVSEVRVDLEKKQATVETADDLAANVASGKELEEKLKEAVEGAGYEVTEIR